MTLFDQVLPMSFSQPRLMPDILDLIGFWSVKVWHVPLYTKPLGLRVYVHSLVGWPILSPSVFTSTLSWSAVHGNTYFAWATWSFLLILLEKFACRESIHTHHLHTGHERIQRWGEQTANDFLNELLRTTQIVYHQHTDNIAQFVCLQTSHNHMTSTDFELTRVCLVE